MQTVTLGPIVGHTDTQSTRIWIRVSDDPGLYELRVRGVGKVPFHSTESTIELGTATAAIDGLRSDGEYRYQVLRRGRAVAGARGSFRTMPPDGSMAEIQFVFVSCNHQEDEGAWRQLAEFIASAKPRFLIMMGDQVYLDESGSVWTSQLRRPAAERRRAIAQKYADNWGREYVREILANIPTYMIWDDHEIRDGWGSWAPDSPTMAARYRRGRKIFRRHDAFFKDARDVYLHFQMAHNPPVDLPVATERKAMPIVMRCGRLLLLALDSRGDRDVFRDHEPVLGAAQWELVEGLLSEIGSEVDALVIVTSAPIASMSPLSVGQRTLGGLRPDVRFFRRGDDSRLSRLITAGGPARSKIDEVRDQWSHAACRPEQARLIRAAAAATATNRIGGSKRAVAFLAGDIHLGGTFDITVSAPKATLPCIISSGISQLADRPIDSIATVDQSFDVAPGIRSKQRTLIQQYNFGVFQVIPTGGTPQTVFTIAHEGRSDVYTGQVG